MNKRILVVVERHEDRKSVADLLLQFIPHEYRRESPEMRLGLRNGDRIDVWSVENWWEGITCGATFDSITYMTRAPKFVKQALESCIWKEKIDDA